MFMDEVHLKYLYMCDPQNTKYSNFFPLNSYLFVCIIDCLHNN